VSPMISSRLDFERWPFISPYGNFLISLWVRLSHVSSNFVVMKVAFEKVENLCSIRALGFSICIESRTKV
jgi:hypothetical protein